MDYCYDFSDLTDNYEVLKAYHRHNNKSYVVDLRIQDEALRLTRIGYVPCVLADLIDIATAVYIAGWLSPRRGNEVLDIEVKMRLRNANLFSQFCNLDVLENLLHWYTMDRWHFEFHQRKKVGREVENRSIQMQFPFATDACEEVALWSGGLDSLAGLCGRIIDKTAKQFTLLGTGSNLQVQGKQSEIAQGVQRMHPGRVKLIQMPIQLEYPEARPLTSDAFRSRGFTFKLLGAVCAYLEGQSVLSIYENGYGAINLPFKLSEIGVSHTRAVHPQSLIYMGRFVSKILGTNFKCHNPYLFSTKAQMSEGMSTCKDLAFQTLSCDGRHRQTNQPSQCGYCSSCLLRRISLINAFGFDGTSYLDTSLCGRRSKYFDAMQLQVAKLNQILYSQDPWQDLIERYTPLRQLAGHLSKELGMTEVKIQSQILHLYRKHIDEWVRAEPLLKQSPVY